MSEITTSVIRILVILNVVKDLYKLSLSCKIDKTLNSSVCYRGCLDYRMA